MIGFMPFSGFATELVFESTPPRARIIATRPWALLLCRRHDTDRVGHWLGTRVPRREHFVMTPDHWKDDPLPKLGELRVRHL
jgi:hypothetical protein